MDELVYLKCDCCLFVAVILIRKGKKKISTVRYNCFLAMHMPILFGKS